MPANLVNLDALIERLDLDTASPSPAKTGKLDAIHAMDLTRGHPFFSVLRKPDFQRETAIWSPERVRDLIVAFVAEDLVPAVILWRDPMNHFFVIDGAHRLSSLIAWVNNDYGIGSISQDFFEGVDPARKYAAEKTKSMVEEAVGNYQDISESFKVTTSTKAQKDIAARLLNCVLPAQWLNGDATKAEKSFFKINQQGVPLDSTELTLLYSRQCPNSIAARALNQRGTGHLQSAKFTPENKKEIETIAVNLHNSLFTPPLMTNTVKSPDHLPLAGRSAAATSLSLLLDTVNLTNGITGTVPTSKENAEELVPPDIDGTKTVDFLKKTRKIIYRISSYETHDDMSSLDLHPLVYFYSNGGKHLPSSFLAVVELMNEYEKNNSFHKFTLIREPFEEFLVNHKDFIQQVSRHVRGQIKAVHKIKEFLAFIAKQVEAGNTDDDIVANLQASDDFSFLKVTVSELKTKQEFTAGVKSKVVITHELEVAKRCQICNARVPNLGVSFDHKQDKKLAGIGDAANAQFTHHYCNSAKDKLLPLFAKKGLKSETAKTETI
jgi:hypothetical protein